MYFVGPWNLLLEREIGNQFQVVQMQSVATPGFGFTFYDLSAPLANLTYRVCVTDANGLRCGAPFTTTPPVDCGCQPLSCEFFQACNTTISNGCGGITTCGNDCTNGLPCLNGACCPAGTMPNGNGTCVCAPPGPCPGDGWNVILCKCEPGG